MGELGAESVMMILEQGGSTKAPYWAIRMDVAGE